MSGILDFFRNAGKDPYLEALHAESAGDFAKAAGIYEEMATEYYGNNALICAGHCGDAAVSYLKADNIGKVREMENTAIQSLHNEGYLKDENNRLDILWKAVCAIYNEGFEQEAAFFVEQINEKLIVNHCPLRISIGADVKSKIKVVECPHCGASFKATIGVDSKCPYCQCDVTV